MVEPSAAGIISSQNISRKTSSFNQKIYSGSGGGGGSEGERNAVVKQNV